MFSSATGSEQFMYRVGQLSQESDITWHFDYVGYHGLRCVSDIRLISIENFCGQRLKPDEINQCSNLVKRLSPLIKDPITFHLISIIALLDTSNLIKGYFTSFDSIIEDTKKVAPGNTSHWTCNENARDLANSFESCAPEVSDVFLGDDDMHLNTAAITIPTTPNRTDLSCVEKKHRNYILEKRFQGIMSLQKHYIHLLQNYCKHSDSSELQCFGNTDEALIRTMHNIQELTYYTIILFGR